MIALHQKSNHQRQDQRGHQTADGNGTEARFLCEIILQVEIDAHKSTVAPFTVVDRRMRSQKISVVVLLEIGGDIGFPGADLREPVVFVFLTEIKPLHIAGRAQLMICAQVW